MSLFQVPSLLNAVLRAIFQRAFKIDVYCNCKLIIWCLKNVFISFLEKVEKIIEISSKLGTIQQCCEFIEDIHKITKCQKPDFPIEIFSAELRKVVFDLMVDYDVHRNFFIKLSVDASKVFWAMFQLQKKGKENVKRIVDSFEALNKQKQIKKG